MTIKPSLFFIIGIPLIVIVLIIILFVVFHKSSSPIHQQYYCDTSNYQCSMTGTGKSYDSQNDCQTNCVRPPPTQYYYCDTSNYQCSMTGTGKSYDSQNDCQTNCVRPPPIKYYCDTSNYQCSMTGTGTSYNTQNDCQTNCVRPPPTQYYYCNNGVCSSTGTGTRYTDNTCNYECNSNMLYVSPIQKLPGKFDTYDISTPPQPVKNDGFVCDYNDGCWDYTKNPAVFTCVDKTFLEYCNICKQHRCIADNGFTGKYRMQDANSEQIKITQDIGNDLGKNASDLYCKFSSPNLNFKESDCDTRPSSTPKCSDPAQGSSIFGKADIYNVNLFQTDKPGEVDIEPPSKIASSYGVCNACLGIEQLTKSSVLGSKGNKCCDENSQPHMHMCPRMMVGSSEFIQAAQDDGLGTTHIYGVVGHDPDRVDKKGIPPGVDWKNLLGTSCPTSWSGGIDNDLTNDGYVCGQCYEIQFEDGSMPKMVVQANNTSAGGGQNFDVYMPAGGYGNYNSCYPRALNNMLKDGDPNLTGNKKPNPSAYTSSFMYTQVPMLNGVLPAGETGITTTTNDKIPWGGWSGGSRGSSFCSDQKCNFDGTRSDDESGCIMSLDSAAWDKIKSTEWSNYFKSQPAKNYYCMNNINSCNLFKGNSDIATTSAQTSCKNVYKNNLHFNNKIKRVRRVQCPENLTRVTGLKRNTPSLPKAGSTWSDNVNDTYTCTYSTENKTLEKTSFTKTTMEDCCKSTCQNSENVIDNGGDLDSQYNVIYTCGKDGIPFIYNDKEQKEIDKIMNS